MITIIGVGALGSHVAMLLRNYDLKLVDFDKIEQKNLQAQFHSKMGLRKNKAQSLAQMLQGMFGVKVHTVPHKLTVTNAGSLIEGSELVIDCTDNLAARMNIQDFTKDYIPCLHGAVSADGTFARIVWTEHFQPDAEGEDGEATCEDGEALPFFALSASLIAIEAQSFLKTEKKRSYQLTPTSITRLI